MGFDDDKFSQKHPSIGCIQFISMHTSSTRQQNFTLLSHHVEQSVWQQSDSQWTHSRGSL